ARRPREPRRSAAQPDPRGALGVPHPVERAGVGALHRPADGGGAAAAVPAVRQADQVAAPHAAAGSEGPGAQGQAQGRPRDDERRDDEAVQGQRRQPDLRVPAAPAAAAGLLRAVHRDPRVLHPRHRGPLRPVGGAAARGRGRQGLRCPDLGGLQQPRRAARLPRRNRDDGPDRGRDHGRADGRDDVLDAAPDDGAGRHHRPAADHGAEAAALRAAALLRRLGRLLPDRRAALLADDQRLVDGAAGLRHQAHAAAQPERQRRAGRWRARQGRRRQGPGRQGLRWRQAVPDQGRSGRDRRHRRR
ncbi:MAG: Inner membrane protein translocase and chaperone YidC, short form OxaI-like, partial [uncultured Blastococcus sp.]